MNRTCSGRIATVGNMVYLTIAGSVLVSRACYALTYVTVDRNTARNPQLQVYQNR